MNKLISVICPYFNRESYLSECITSIISQTYEFWELLLINDGSTDQSETIAKQFNDRRIRHFSLNHHGCWASKNYGIKQSRGNYICFIDSDDMISETYLETAINKVRQNDSFDYYYPTALDILNDKGESSNTIWRYINYPANERHRLISLFYTHLIGGIPHAGALIKKSLFDQLGLYDASLTNLADTVFIVKNALNIRFCMVEDLRHYYNRQHPYQTNKISYARHLAFSQLLDYVIEHYDPLIYIENAENLTKYQIIENHFQRFLHLSEIYADSGELYRQYAEKYLRKLRELDKE